MALELFICCLYIYWYWYLQVSLEHQRHPTYVEGGVTILGSGSFQPHNNDASHECQGLLSQQRTLNKKLVAGGGFVCYHLPPPAAYNQGYAASPSGSPIFNPTSSLRRTKVDKSGTISRVYNNKQDAYCTPAQFEHSDLEKETNIMCQRTNETGFSSHNENTEGWVNPLLRYNQQPQTHFLEDQPSQISPSNHKGNPNVSVVDLIHNVGASERIGDTSSLKRKPRNTLRQGQQPTNDLKSCNISTIDRKESSSK